MSFPNIPDIDLPVDISFDDSTNLNLALIAYAF